MHLTIDAYGANTKKLASVDLVHQTLDSLPGKLGFTKICEPQISTYIGTKPEDRGISGFVLISESHIAIHTFPERGYVWTDVFSCKKFNTEIIEAAIGSIFEPDEIRTQVIERGLEYPHYLEGAQQVNSQERQQHKVTREESNLGGPERS